MLEYLSNQPAADHARILDLISRPRVEMAMMIFLDFASQPVRLSNRTLPFVDNETGQTWDAGAGMLIGIPTLGVSDGDLAPQRMFQLGMPIEWMVSDNFRADLVEMVTDRPDYFGRTSQVLEQLFDPDTGQPVGNPTVLESGRMDRLSVSFSVGGAVVSLTTEGLLSRKGTPVYGIQTYRDQKRRFPTDEGLQFTSELDKLVTWTDF